MGTGKRKAVESEEEAFVIAAYLSLTNLFWEVY